MSSWAPLSPGWPEAHSVCWYREWESLAVPNQPMMVCRVQTCIQCSLLLRELAAGAYCALGFWPKYTKQSVPAGWVKWVVAREIRQHLMKKPTEGTPFKGKIQGSLLQRNVQLCSGWFRWTFTFDKVTRRLCAEAHNLYIQHPLGPCVQYSSYQPYKTI